uniref:POU domain, class 2, transcription factor 3 n=1 Tax=Lygus hesperus TaxID=30085 RepID=A0A0A9W1N6_LYGHE
MKTKASGLPCQLRAARNTELPKTRGSSAALVLSSCNKKKLRSGSVGMGKTPPKHSATASSTTRARSCPAVRGRPRSPSLHRSRSTDRKKNSKAARSPSRTTAATRKVNDTESNVATPFSPSSPMPSL